MDVVLVSYMSSNLGSLVQILHKCEEEFRALDGHKGLHRNSK